MDQVTRGWLMYQLTGSALDVGLATAVRGLPLLLFGVIAGALADRSGRKVQLVVSQTVNAILNLILATLVLTHQVQPWHVYVTGFLVGSVQAFEQPARQTLISDLVGNDRLMNALALNSAALNGSRVIGPGISGALIVFLGISRSYYLQAIMFLVATVWTMQMRVPPEHIGAEQRRNESFFTSLAKGLAYVSTHKSIRTQLILALGPLTFGMSYTSMMPVIATQVLHGGAGVQGFLLSCIGAGALSGALIVASIRRSHAYGSSVVIGATLFCCGVFLFASSHWLLVSAALGVLVGTFSVTYTTQDQTLLQVTAPRHIRGRVMSIFLLNRGLVPMGAALVGTLASHFGAANGIRIMSASGLAIVALVVLTNPGILTLKLALRSEIEEARLSEEAAAEAEAAAGRSAVARGASRPEPVAAKGAGDAEESSAAVEGS
jgi:MFS transporter, DHA1 family, staphyloferrin A biosynthesis exporter